MPAMEIIEGYVESVNKLGEVTISPRGGRTSRQNWIENVKPIVQGAVSSGIYIGAECLCLKIGGGYYMLGIYKTPDLDGLILPLLQGEKIIWAGSYRGILFSPNGDIGIVTFKKNADGSLSREPVLYYSKDTEQISIQSEGFILGVLGANIRGNVVIEQDAKGNFVYVFEGKTNLYDMGARFRLTISNPSVPVTTENADVTPQSMMNLKIDTLPLPILPTDSLNTKSLTIGMGAHSNGFTGFSMSFENYCNLLVGLNLLAPDNLISLTTSSGSKIEIKNTGDMTIGTAGGKLAITAAGSVSLQSPAGIAINIAPSGAISIMSQDKVEIQAQEISLLGKININTLPGAPGFGLLGFCPVTGAKLTISEVTGTRT